MIHDHATDRVHFKPGQRLCAAPDWPAPDTNPGPKAPVPRPQASGSTPLRAHFDAGWPYLLAGALLVAAMMLIGPADDLAQIRLHRDRLAALESDAVARLKTYETFLEAIDEADPMLVRRLAAAQLNLVPETVQPIGLIGVELDAHVDHWIRETLPPAASVAPPVVKDSWLRRLADGPTRLWAILAGVVLIFIGLLPQSEAGEAAKEETHRRDRRDRGEDIDEDDGIEPQSVPAVHHPIVTEEGELIEADQEVEEDEEESPLVQVINISASSVW